MHESNVHMHVAYIRLGRGDRGRHLKARISDAAKDAKLSLNDFCLRALKAHLLEVSYDEEMEQGEAIPESKEPSSLGVRPSQVQRFEA